MNVIDMLMRDHERVRELFESYSSLHEDDTAAKRRLVERLHQELEDHAGVEEHLFYPAVDSRSGEDLESAALVREAYEEHRRVSSLLSEIADLEPDDESFEAKLKALRTMVDEHVQEEESTLLPQAKRLLSPGELERLGREVQQQRAEQRTELLATAGPGDIVPPPTDELPVELVSDQPEPRGADEDPVDPPPARRLVRRSLEHTASSRPGRSVPAPRGRRDRK
jgi:hemerythrin superfamily protein